MRCWVKCLSVITTALVLNFSAIDGLHQGEKLEILPAFAQDVSYNESQVDKLLKEGDEYYQNWEYEKALKAFQQVLELRREMGDLAAEGRALFYVGAAYEKLGKGEKALDYFWEILGVVDEMNNPDQAEVVRKYLCFTPAAKKILSGEGYNLETYCTIETESSSVTLLLDEDGKKE